MTTSYRHYGFTGSQDGPTPMQGGALLRTLRTHQLQLPKVHGVELVLHHGDCVGGDAFADEGAKLYDWLTALHIPDNDSKRAFCRGAAITHDPLPYLHRNRKIVDDCVLGLLATPSGREVLRSGTWSTIRYARGLGRRITIFWPDGSVTKENFR